ncbi:MAG: hypothetical protein H7210_03755 [Pyrinomonadaceae bacterium]|nr:hypothetical protein [Phycisphaerales bacterium]
MKRQGSKTTSTSTAASTGHNTAPTPEVAGSQKKPTASVSAEIKPSLDDLRRRAYEVYLNRQSTGTPGTPDSDWKQAEVELTRR